MAVSGNLASTGRVGLQVIRKDAWQSDELADKLRGWTPRSMLGMTIFRVLPMLPAEAALELLDRIQSVAIIESSLRLLALRWPASRFWAGQSVEDYGIVSRKVVTDAYVAALVDVQDGAVGFADIANFKYHGIGTGSTAEAASQTALVTELTTEYTGNVRATGTASQPSANIYRNTGTNTLDSGTPALREHSVFSANAVGTMMDRSLFAAINLDGTAGDGLQSQYSLTFTSGG